GSGNYRNGAVGAVGDIEGCSIGRYRQSKRNLPDGDDGGHGIGSGVDHGYGVGDIVGDIDGLAIRSNRYGDGKNKRSIGYGGAYRIGGGCNYLDGAGEISDIYVRVVRRDGALGGQATQKYGGTDGVGGGIDHR